MKKGFLRLIFTIYLIFLWIYYDFITFRDLAARNCLISKDKSNNLIVKIGDFGLAKNVCNENLYIVNTNRSLPIRWMSPESLANGIFTSKTDVW